MDHYYWNNLYTGWGWFLWLGVIFLMFSSIGNWGYSYRVHRRYGTPANRSEKAIDLASERYASGEINREEFHRIKSDILSNREAAISSDALNMKPQVNY